MVIIKILRHLVIFGAILIGVALCDDFLSKVIVGCLFGKVMIIICDIHDSKYKIQENTEGNENEDSN